MANIKFSDFTVGNTEGDIDFVVGYKGASNIQISPTNLLASALGNYLPLAGGTMTGDLKIIDNIQLQMGNGLDFRLYHDATNSIMSSGTGDLYIQNTADDKDIIFRSDNGAGGLSAYITLDGNNVRTQIDREMRFMDTIPAKFGTGGDLQIQHSSTDSFIENNTGNLFISNFANDKDIRFATDDGSGGVTTYLFLDGSSENVQFAKPLFLYDNIILNIGNAFDLRLYHDGNSNIKAQGSGNLIISQTVDDADISFQCDNGSGSLAEYFRLDGSSVQTIVEKDFRFIDNVKAILGTGSDLNIFHDGSNSYLENKVGDLILRQEANDGDIIFKSDDGSGGDTEYFKLDGSEERNLVSKNMDFLDNVKLRLGTGSGPNLQDLQIYHTGTHSFIDGSNGTGSLYLRPGTGGTIQLETISGADMISANATDIRMYSNGMKEYV